MIRNNEDLGKMLVDLKFVGDQFDGMQYSADGQKAWLPMGGKTTAAHTACMRGYMTNDEYRQYFEHVTGEKSSFSDAELDAQK